MGLLHCRQILYLLNYKGSSLLCLPPAEFPNPKTELMSPALQADSLLSEPTGKPKGGKNTQKNSAKKLFMIQITMML